MKPVITITDSMQEQDKVSYREKTVKLFGVTLHKRIETYVGERKERAVGFTDYGVNLTEVEDDYGE